jgi:hypothetical protein
MNYNWPIITDKIFGILRGRGYRLKMYDKSGMDTMDPHDATRFFVTIPSYDPALKNFSILVSLHDEDSSSHLDIKTPSLKNDDDWQTVVQLKNSLMTNVGDNEGLSVNWYKFDHDIDLRDDAVNNIKESRDISKPYGSTKSSYQNIGSSKLIIRHTDPVNEDKQGSRWRHIRSIFIETKLGERFNYPHAHIAGARAMARHLANEGRFTDPTAKAIIKMSEDYIKLKNAASLMRQAGDDDRTLQVKQALHKLGKDSKRLAGSRGYAKGIHDLANMTSNLNANDVLQLRNSLAETCGCSRDNHSNMDALNTAARYILILPKAVVDEDLIRLEELAGIADF